MKNFYELDSKDRKKYLEEFRKTYVCKELSILVRLFFIGLIAIVCVETILSFIGESSINFDLLMVLVILLLNLIAIFYYAAAEICFARWLKIKYKIQN